MANSVSNDALWGKLVEIDEKISNLSAEQKSQLLNGKQSENTSDFSGIKDEIIAGINEQCKILGMHSDSNYNAFAQNWSTTDEDVKKILNIVSRIRKQQKETVERQSEYLCTQEKANQEYFSLWLFKIRKTSVVITLLGLLVLILTLFCMKQQNDYTLLNQKYHRQSISIQEVQAAADSIRNNAKPETSTRRK